MAKRRKRARERKADPALSDKVSVIVCRGGDCGNRTKHPELDHAAQLAKFRTQVVAEQATVIASKCLDACEHSNVVVVTPGAEGRIGAATSVWVGGVNDIDTTSDIIRWVNAGGPGPAPQPTLVQIRAFNPSRLSRRELESGDALP